MITTSAFVLILNFILVCYALQKTIYISHKKHLFDEPFENRKIHLTKTPNLGGVAIFLTVMVTSSLFLPYASIPHLNYLVTGAVIIFVVGLIDDLVGVN